MKSSQHFVHKDQKLFEVCHTHFDPSYLINSFKRELEEFQGTLNNKVKKQI